jgi:hypothetical protein
MMNRRGMARAHSHWRPQRRTATTASRASPSRWRRSRSGVLVMVFMTSAAGLMIAAVALRGGRSGGPVLPATPDGRATFTFAPPVREGKPHVIWRRIGGHDVLDRP